MFTNRISGHFEQNPGDAKRPATDNSTSSNKSALTSEFAVVPTFGMVSGVNIPAMPNSIYDIARREAIAQSQQRLLSLLRSRWNFLNGQSSK